MYYGDFFPLTSVGMIASQEITRKFSTQRIQKEKQKQKFHPAKASTNNTSVPFRTLIEKYEIR